MTSGAVSGWKKKGRHREKVNGMNSGRRRKGIVQYKVGKRRRE